jgi:hypothetical protein
MVRSVRRVAVVGGWFLLTIPVAAVVVGAIHLLTRSEKSSG